MRRKRIIITAIGLAIIGAIIPMLTALIFSWILAFKEESKTLHEYTTRMLTRAKHTLDEARSTFTYLENQKKPSLPCSDKHIKLMEEAMSSIMDAKAISYFKNEKEQCMSCAIPGISPHHYQPEFILPDGLELALDTQASFDTETALVVLRTENNYTIYVDPRRFSDIIVPPETWIAIVYKKKLITQNHKITKALLQRILNHLNTKDLSEYYETIHGKEQLKQAEELKEENVFLIDKHLISINRYGPFYFIAAEPETFVYQSYKIFQLILLPLGLMTAAFIVGLVFYYSQRHLSFKAELQNALKNQELIVHYQPIVATESGACFGAEALVRWQRSTGEIIRPDFFISLAEETGLIFAITSQVIDIIFTEVGPFLVQNKNLHISINVSAEELETGQIIDLLEAKIAKTSIERNQLWLELTERTVLDFEKTIKTIQRARELGYVIVIDDFGTGFSSLSYLQVLPIDLIKIDKSFISSLRIESNNNMTDHIIEMAKSLNLKMVAENVETEEQCDYLKKKKVDYLQGYLFSMPLSATEFIHFITNAKLK